jgi:hypothetical protein
LSDYLISAIQNVTELRLISCSNITSESLAPLKSLELLTITNCNNVSGNAFANLNLGRLMITTTGLIGELHVPLGIQTLSLKDMDDVYINSNMDLLALHLNNVGLTIGPDLKKITSKGIYLTDMHLNEVLYDIISGYDKITIYKGVVVDPDVKRLIKQKNALKKMQR